MLRLLAWIKYADERLQFTRGLAQKTSREAPAATIIWVSDLWIELGLPDERRLKKGVYPVCGSGAIHVHNQRAAGEIWWQQTKSKCGRFKNLTVWYLD